MILGNHSTNDGGINNNWPRSHETKSRAMTEVS